MVQNIQPFSPPQFRAGGFNNPPGSPQVGTGFNNTPVNNAFATMGQNPTLAGTNPMTQFNAATYNPFANNPEIAMLYQSATGQADPMLVAAQLGLKPQNITAGPGGFPVATGAGMKSMELNIALGAAKNAIQTNPATGQPKDVNGFISLMEKLSKDRNALLNPEFQQLVPTYQAMMGTISTQSNSIATGANAAQAQQMAQIQQQLNQFMQTQQAILAIITDSKGLEGLSASDLAAKLALAMQSASATTPAVAPATTTPVTTTAATPTQSLLQKTINPKAT